MVRISSKTSYRRTESKKEPPQQSTVLKSDVNDQSSSKILSIVRQALLNAAEELLSQRQQESDEKQILNMPQSLNDLGNRKRYLNKSPCQRNTNALSKKKAKRKNYKISKNKLT